MEEEMVKDVEEFGCIIFMMGFEYYIRSVWCVVIGDFLNMLVNMFWEDDFFSGMDWGVLKISWDDVIVYVRD